MHKQCRGRTYHILPSRSPPTEHDLNSQPNAPTKAACAAPSEGHAQHLPVAPCRLVTKICREINKKEEKRGFFGKK